MAIQIKKKHKKAFPMWSKVRTDSKNFLTLSLLRGGGGGMESIPQAVFPALLRNEKRLSLKLGDFFMDQWVTIAPSNLRIDLSMFLWQWLKLREFENDIVKKKNFSILTSEMETATIN